MAVTQKQIAQELGVSHQLVSFALNGSGNVSEATRQEIVTAAQRMGYRRNELARAMVTGKSSTLGFLTHQDDQTEHFMKTLTGAIDAANGHGYFIKAMHNIGASDIRGILERCLEWQLAGLLVMNLMDDALEQAQIESERLQFPIVFIENTPAMPADVWVRSDDYDGLRQVISHLKKLGHTKIAFLNGNAQSRLSIKRDDHFRRLMDLFGLELREEWIACGHWLGDPELIEPAARSLLMGRERPTAVVCAGDPLAMVMIRVAQQMGLKLPEELSITGFANFFLSSLTNPSLTTVDQSFRVMGQVAVENLIALTNGSSLSPSEKENHLLPTQLIVRESTVPPAL